MASYIRDLENQFVDGLRAHFTEHSVRASARLYSGELESEDNRPLMAIVGQGPAVMIAWASRSVDPDEQNQGRTHAEEHRFECFMAVEDRNSPETRSDKVADLLRHVENFLMDFKPSLSGWPDAKVEGVPTFGSCTLAASTPVFAAIHMPVDLTVRRSN